jgi:DNA-nicking Smr family endonuclease
MFKVGQKITFLYEKGTGIILEILPNDFYLIEDENGFELKMSKNDIGQVFGFDYKLPDDLDIDLNDDDSFSKKSKAIYHEKTSQSKRTLEVWEIDLHIEELIDSHSHMTNFEIVTTQLKAYRNFLAKAKSKRIRKVVIIHGVGEGVLKEEIRSSLSKMEGVDFYDADYREYGKGATTVELKYL